MVTFLCMRFESEATHGWENGHKGAGTDAPQQFTMTSSTGLRFYCDFQYGFSRFRGL